MSASGRESRAERRRRLRARARAMKARLREKRKSLPRRKRWRPSRLWIVPLLLLLLLLIRPCRCTPDPQGPGVAVELLPDTDTDVAEGAPDPTPPLPPLPRVERQPRPAIEPPPPGPPSWLESFRLQVAARSPRLAACIEGAEAPGRLKWTTTVEPDHGHVTGHTLEPMLESVILSTRERRCITDVLSDPPYALPPESGAPDGPRRVGLVIEF